MIMEFDEAIKIVCNALADTGTIISADDYDGVAVKKLVSSNTLDEGRATNQTHIAITGSQMDIFPYLCSEGYLTGNEDVKEEDLKKFFVGRIPVDLYASNVEYLNGGEATGILFLNGKRRTNTSIIRSRRSNQADQIQVSLLNFDGPDFITFRRLLHIGTYLIILKKKEELLYEFFGVIPDRGVEGDGNIQSLNNHLFILPTNTSVDIGDLTNSDDGNMQSSVVPQFADNILLYGVPGSGKSYTIKTEYCNDDALMERTVFHPDYTYSDFTGQILPRVDNGHIEYRFEPGPFTRILKKAVDHPENHYFLIVEEINRGNAPAIFGDIFQLLDRDADGASEYGVNNENISGYVYGDADTKIRIPGNLSLLATMNTSDQNVFTLDTAFKRRWNMVCVPNDFENCRLRNIKIDGLDITWQQFAETVNAMIAENLRDSLGGEDKRLGAYFATEAQLRDRRQFAEKVLAYLWDDVFRYDPEVIFSSGVRTLEELVASFADDGLSVFSSQISEDFRTFRYDMQ